MTQLQLDGGGGLPVDSFHERPVSLGHSMAVQMAVCVDPSLYRVDGKNTNILLICMTSILSARFSQLGGRFFSLFVCVYVYVCVCVTVCVK